MLSSGLTTKRLNIYNRHLRNQKGLIGNHRRRRPEALDSPHYSRRTHVPYKSPKTYTYCHSFVALRTCLSSCRRHGVCLTVITIVVHYATMCAQRVSTCLLLTAPRTDRIHLHRSISGRSRPRDDQINREHVSEAEWEAQLENSSERREIVAHIPVEFVGTRFRPHVLTEYDFGNRPFSRSYSYKVCTEIVRHPWPWGYLLILEP